MDTRMTYWEISKQVVYETDVVEIFVSAWADLDKAKAAVEELKADFQYLYYFYPNIYWDYSESEFMDMKSFYYKSNHDDPTADFDDTTFIINERFLNM
jgi:hypothetical protein